MTLTVQPPVVPAPALDGDLAEVARAVHEEFDARLEPRVVDECFREVAARFDDARVRSFVPLLVRRYTRDALQTRLGAA